MRGYSTHIRVAGNSMPQDFAHHLMFGALHAQPEIIESRHDWLDFSCGRQCLLAAGS
jgi:hypothetical protein